MNDKKKRYKILSDDMISPFQGFKYELGVDYHCDNFDESNEDCSNGFYATGLEGLVYSWLESHKCYECEVWGKEKEIDLCKMRYENIRILRRISEDELKELLKKESPNLKYNVYEVLYPVNPLKDKPVELTEEMKQLLKEWVSVGNSIRNSVRNSVWDSVGTSVGTSVRNSVWAYISILFPISNWKYIDHIIGVNPFQSAIDLWRMGVVASFDGKVWRLHSGKDAVVIYKWIPSKDGAE